MHNYLKVEGSDSLIRDMSTHAIINTNSSEYENYMRQRNRSLSQIEKLEQHDVDINTIKRDLVEIKSLIMSLVNKGI